MTTAELLYLLAAARGSVFQHKERLLDCGHDAESCTCDLAAQKIALLDRIDAALAEGCPDCGHRYGQQEYCQGDGHAEPLDSATPVVEWRRTETRPTVFRTYFEGADMEIQLGADRWHWEVTREGDEDTLDEAQRAALAAARGRR